MSEILKITDGKETIKSLEVYPVDENEQICLYIVYDYDMYAWSKIYINKKDASELIGFLQKQIID